LCNFITFLPEKIFFNTKKRALNALF